MHFPFKKNPKDLDLGVFTFHNKPKDLDLSRYFPFQNNPKMDRDLWDCVWKGIPPYYNNRIS